MKILRLTIKNLASIEDADIDFDNGPLSAVSLFLISGETGSGKTTILNAICLALYDKVPALVATDSRNNEDADGLRVGSSCQLMRKGTGHAEVHLWFVGNDGNSYEIVWQVQRAHKKASGAMQDVKRSLRLIDDKKGYVETNKRPIEKKVIELVGLTFDQFTRTTMLAQGQFASFIKASDEDKSSILEKLTGTEEYSAIGKRISEAYNKAREDVNNLKLRIAANLPMSDDERAQINQQLVEADAEVTRLSALVSTIDTKLQWLSTDSRLATDIATKDLALQTATTALESEQTRHMQSVVNDWDKTAKIRSLADEHTTACQRLRTMTKSLEEIAGGTWHKILDGIAWLADEQSRLNISLTSLTEHINKLSPFVPIYDNAQRISVLAKSIIADTKEADRHLAARLKMLDKVTASQNQERVLANKLESAKQAIDKRQAEIDKAEERRGQHDMEAINNSLSEIDKRLEHLRKTLTAIDRYHDCELSAKKADDDLDQITAALSQTRTNLDAANEQLPTLTADYERANAYLQGQMDIKDHIVALRQTFAQTDICPLCGTRGVHIHDDASIDSQLALSRAKANEAKSALDKTTTSISGFKAELKVLDTRHKSALALSKQATSALADATKVAADLYPDFASEKAHDIINSQITALESDRCQVADNLKTAVDIYNLCQRLHKLYDQERSAIDKLTSDSQSQHQTTMTLQNNAESLKAMADNSMMRADNALAEISTLTTFDDQQAKQHFDQLLYQAIGHTAISAKSVEDVATYISAAAANFAKAIADRDSLQSNISAIEMRRTAAEAAVEVLAGRFGRLHTPTPTVCDNLEQTINSTIAEVSSLDGSIKNQSEIIERLHEQMVSWYQDSDLTPDDVARIATRDQATVDNYRNSVSKIVETHRQAIHELDLLKAQRDSHNSTKPESITDDECVESVTKLKTQTDTLRQQAIADRATLQKTIADDDEKIKSGQHLLNQLDRLVEIRDQWQDLDDIFGTANGARFKKIAQSYLLRVLLGKANHYLDMLTNRYRLDCDDKSLSINVIDMKHGNRLRNVALLSGGETFIVSLALALGLSSVNKSAVNVDPLFIDEGFGTLDHESLDMVVSMLERLHTIGGRRIGIISHVDDLKERIPTQICLVRNGPSVSRLEIVSR